ncbi:hypothetical protein B0I37DRAFT_179050 [Chaetomium sp. MPI-CAGE-AT-0009]|nr:hypothetical protein B0I37DRAFT_179050 [Chaetomium sp. MPI-CAGE-AT-0009]
MELATSSIFFLERHDCVSPSAEALLLLFLVWLCRTSFFCLSTALPLVGCLGCHFQSGIALVHPRNTRPCLLICAAGSGKREARGINLSIAVALETVAKFRAALLRYTWSSSVSPNFHSIAVDLRLLIAIERKLPAPFDATPMRPAWASEL